MQLWFILLFFGAFCAIFIELLLLLSLSLFFLSQTRGYHIVYAFILVCFNTKY